MQTYREQVADDYKIVVRVVVRSAHHTDDLHFREHESTIGRTGGRSVSREPQTHSALKASAQRARLTWTRTWQRSRESFGVLRDEHTPLVRGPDERTRHLNRVASQ